ncbi:DEAD/DEAH box helicase [Nocardioides yefusunii]|uniref:SNF2-related protein n=1 Tax=Nocardioides yefusunii TaxID=2500546 RepID=A0ABW1R4B9_9ACTN|nr:DEAD/DEAH box helicase [Nocardioides yefusunii]
MTITDLANGAFEAGGIVVGSRTAPYRVRVTVKPAKGRAGATISTKCDCPVAYACKHAVAVLQDIRQAELLKPTVAPPAWRRSLDAVLAPLEEAKPVVAERKKLALQFEIPVPTRRRYRGHADAGQKLWLRPMRQGARDNWIKTGISWATAENHAVDEAHDLDQLAVLSRFVRAVTGVVNKDVIDLTTIGPALPDLLAQAVEAGIALVGGERISQVRLADPVEAVVDIGEADSDGDAKNAKGATQLRVGVWNESHLHVDDELLLLGKVPHTAALVTPVRANTTAEHPKVHLTLAPLARRLPEALVQVHQRGEILAIPAEDKAAFEKEYLPRLRQQLVVTSSDAAIEIAEEAAPRLEAVVAWESATAEVSWRWRYESASGQVSTYPIVGGDRALAVRRPVVERDLLAAVAEFAHLQPHVTVTGSPVVDFAATDLPALEAHEGVDVVETGDRPDFRSATEAPTFEFATGPAEDGDEDDTTTDWLDLRVVIEVEGEQVPLTDLLTALTTGQPLLVLASGLHIPTDRPEFRRLAALVAAAGQIEGGRGDAFSVAHSDLGLWAELAELGIVDARAAEWVEAARALIGHETLPEVEVAGLVSTPRPYQREGINWLAHLWSLDLGGILADDMGLGKTLQTLALMSHARAHGAAPFVVIAPTSVMTAWTSEAARHTPGLVVKVVDASASRRKETFAEAIEGADVVVTSYTLLRLEADEYAHRTWGGLVLDEAQAIKNHHSKTYQAVARIKAPFRLVVSGTPFENRLMELWALLSIAAPGLYPWPHTFVDQVVAPVEKRGDTDAMDRFRARVRPFVLRRTKDLVASDLPPKQEQVLEVPLGAEHQRIYDTWLQRERQAILGLVDDFAGNRVQIFTALTRLRQLSLDAALVSEEHDEVGSAKLDVLVEHLTELAAEGHRALVFSQFTSFLKRARERLEDAGLTVRYLDGSTRNRGAEIEAFKNGDGDAFLISLKAGGVGLTLTEADYVYVLDPWWNPAAENQAIDRAHRIGQQRPVNVYRMVSAGTIEEKVMALKERKAALFDAVFTGEGAVGSGLDADDVRALFD